MKVKFILGFLFLSSLFSGCIQQQAPKEEKPLVKGDGTYWYNEPRFVGSQEYYIHHSTLECPAIKMGVQRDCFQYNQTSNTFCPVCMDNLLISRWENEHKGNFR